MESPSNAINDNRPAVACRRLARRSRVLLSGRLLFGQGGALTQDCRIRDLSDAGARIVAEHGEGFRPGGLLIVIKQGVAHRTEVVWTRDTELGLKFLTSHDLDRPEAWLGCADLSHARSLWLELAARPAADATRPRL